jgi:hypothetical protein
MRRALVAAAIVLGTSGLGGGARAQCETSTFLEIQLGITTLYYDDRSELPPAPGAVFGGGTYIYMESNSVEGLQTGGYNIIERTLGIDMGPMFHSEPCASPDPNGDMLIGKSCESPSDYLDVPTCL